MRFKLASFYNTDAGKKSCQRNFADCAQKLLTSFDKILSFLGFHKGRRKMFENKSEEKWLYFSNNDAKTCSYELNISSTSFI